jgi:hypothetical protein
MPGGTVPTPSDTGPGDWVLDWCSDRRNATRDLAALHAVARRAPAPLVCDLLDIATATYLADIASLRGRLAEWVRDLDITVPVRDPGFWQRVTPDLQHLLYTLSRDNVRLTFTALEDGPEVAPAPAGGPRYDSVCLLSGGLDSFAGAVMLQHTGRQPLLVSHQSGNPTTEAAQQHVVSVLGSRTGPTPGWAPVRLAPWSQAREGLPFPGPQERESSRRLRSFLFLALGAYAASLIDVPEVYLCENGVLTAALPLTPARAGSLSTRSTHPLALKLFEDILAQAGLPCTVTNPFVHQTKGEVLRTVLRPLVPPAQIARSVSCWAAGRQNRPCGGCIPCLLRRIALLSAGLPDEAVMMDLLATPDEYRGTDAYGNLVDLLTQASALLERTEMQILLDFPQLLDMDTAGVDVRDVVKTLKRHAAEVYTVVGAHFPASARLLEDQSGL